MSNQRYERKQINGNVIVEDVTVWFDPKKKLKLVAWHTLVKQVSEKKENYYNRNMAEHDRYILTAIDRTAYFIVNHNQKSFNRRIIP